MLQSAPASLRTRIGGYVALTKPRIIELLLITTVPTMVVANQGIPSGWLMLNTVIGGALAAGGANAINMYVDRDIDALMEMGQPAESDDDDGPMFDGMEAAMNGPRECAAGEKPSDTKQGCISDERIIFFRKFLKNLETELGYDSDPKKNFADVSAYQYVRDCAITSGVLMIENMGDDSDLLPSFNRSKMRNMSFYQDALWVTTRGLTNPPEPRQGKRPFSVFRIETARDRPASRPAAASPHCR